MQFILTNNIPDTKMLYVNLLLTIILVDLQNIILTFAARF